MAKTFRIQKQQKVVDKIKHGYLKYCYRAAFSEDKLFNSAGSKGHLKKYFKVFSISNASWLSHVHSWPCLYNLHFSNASTHVSGVNAPSTSEPTPSPLHVVLLQLIVGNGLQNYFNITDPQRSNHHWLV